MTFGSVSRAATVSATYNAVVDNVAVLSGSPPISTAYVDSVYRGTLGESRVQYEFPLPALPAGSVINSINFNTYIGEYQSNSGVYPNVNMYGYAGNGVSNAADATQLSNLVYNTGTISSGGHRSYLLSAPANTIASNGASHLGLNLYAQQTNLAAGFVRQGNYANVPSITVNATIPDVGTLSTKPLFDQKATLSGGNFTLAEGESGINTQYLPQASVDRRGIMEFNLGAMQDAVLTGATIQFYVSSMTSNNVPEYPQARIYGYAGNALADLSDVSQTGTLLGISPIVTNIGTLVTVNLNASQIQSLLNTSPYLGLMVLGSENGQQFGFATLEGTAFGPAPTLALNYSIPEPTTLAILAPLGLLYGMRRRR